MTASPLFDMSKLTRRKVDMNALPDTSKTLQERIHEEAERRCRGTLGSRYNSLCTDSERDQASTERSFEERVSKIVENTIYWANHQ